MGSKRRVKLMIDQSVKVRHEERLATTSELNPTPGRVTDHSAAGGTGYQAVTQVKELSPETVVIPVAEAFPLAEGNILIVVKRDGANLAGSETTAWYQRVNTGTRETRYVLKRLSMASTSPRKVRLTR